MLQKRKEKFMRKQQGFIFNALITKHYLKNIRETHINEISLIKYIFYFFYNLTSALSF